MDVNEELKFLGKFTKNIRGGGKGGMDQVGGRVGGGQGGCERNVGGRGDEGYGNQEKKVLYNVQKGIVQY